ncbi:MAG: FkbM family methyltransferase [Lachnospiraceae bacterium]|nr:FkbM family methyltransferase [Lachnospiraceae bacterium]
MQELNQIHSLLQTINACKKKLTAKNIFIARPEFVPFLKDWSDAISNAALQLYGVTPRYTAQFLDILGDSIRKNKSLLPAYQVYDEWEKIFLTDYEFLNGLPVRTDYEFEKIMLAVTRATPEALLQRLLDVFRHFEKELPEVARIMTGCYSNWNHLWGDFDPKSGNYAHFINGILDLKEHTEDYKDFYYNLSDYRSKCVLIGILKFRLELDLAYKETIRETIFKQYFDFDILKEPMPDGVFVDCGAYDGDTALDFLNSFSGCRKMYLYEMVPSCIRKAQENLKDYDNIVYRNVGVGSREQVGTTVKIQDFVGTSASIQSDNTAYNPLLTGRDVQEEPVDIPLAALDEDITEPITFLKMDIEGSEINALLGAKEHIVNDKPRLAVCTYHNYSHLWQAMQTIRQLRPDYRFYLRFYGKEGSVTESEHVLYAI